MGKLRELNFSGTSISEVPSSIEHLNGLEELRLEDCEKLVAFCENIGSLSSLKSLKLKGCLKLKGLPSSIKHLKALKNLGLSNCKNLVRLPESICSLSSLETLFLDGCSKFKGFPEIKGDMNNLRVLNLDSTAIKEIPSSITHLKALEYLNLSRSIIVSLPESICSLTSLKTISVEECSALQKLPEDLGGLSRLEILSFSYIKCDLPCLSSLFSLKELTLQGCNVKQGVIKRDSRLSSLKTLILTDCNLMGGVILDICLLLSLKELHLSSCNIRGIPKDIFCLSSLEILNLDGNHFSSIPAGINRLRHLTALNLRHCKKLQRIPELPSSLRLLDVHGPSDDTSSRPSLLPSLHSLVNCLNMAIQDSKTKNRHNSKGAYFSDSWYSGNGICIVLPGRCGIPKWIKNKRNGSEIEIELPQNWHLNNDFLGFALYCVYAPATSAIFRNEFVNISEFRSIYGSLFGFYLEVNCAASHGDEFQSKDVLSFSSDCECWQDSDFDGGLSWAICYPKVAIQEKDGTHFKASFEGSYYGKLISFEAIECGVHLIYA